MIPEGKYNSIVNLLKFLLSFKKRERKRKGRERGAGREKLFILPSKKWNLMSVFYRCTNSRPLKKYNFIILRNIEIYIVYRLKNEICCRYFSVVQIQDHLKNIISLFFEIYIVYCSKNEIFCWYFTAVQIQTR